MCKCVYVVLPGGVGCLPVRPADVAAPAAKATHGAASAETVVAR